MSFLEVVANGPGYAAVGELSHGWRPPVALKITKFSTPNVMLAGRSHLRSRPANPGNVSVHSWSWPEISCWSSPRQPQLRITVVMRCLRN